MGRLHRVEDAGRAVGSLLGSLALAWAALGPQGANAGILVSPVGAPSNSLGEFGVCCGIGNLFDQSGLSVGFTSGVTETDPYLAQDPLHDFLFQDQEFFSDAGVRSGAIVLDLGSSLGLESLLLWNEDTTGIMNMTVLSSDDVDFLSGTTDHGTFMPIANPDDAPYPVEVFDLTPVTDRFLRIDLACHPTEFNNCGIGEIAVSTVPEPTTVVLLGLAGFAVRRTRLTRRPS